VEFVETKVQSFGETSWNLSTKEERSVAEKRFGAVDRFS
jgi:hypothetical protein